MTYVLLACMLDVVGTGSVPSVALARVDITLHFEVFHTISRDVAFAQCHTKSHVPVRVDRHLQTLVEDSTWDCAKVNPLQRRRIHRVKTNIQFIGAEARIREPVLDNVAGCFVAVASRCLCHAPGDLQKRCVFSRNLAREVRTRMQDIGAVEHSHLLDRTIMCVACHL
jgi:hypothetical protein